MANVDQEVREGLPEVTIDELISIVRRVKPDKDLLVGVSRRAEEYAWARHV